MKKKIIFMMLIVALAVLMVSCSSKNYSVSSKSYDNIVSANINDFIAYEDGEYNLYNSEKCKIICGGYDSLEYVSSYRKDYLVYYNYGDEGKTLISNDGTIVIESSSDMKIYAVGICGNKIINEDKSVSYEEKGFVVYFNNNLNEDKSALFAIDGTPIYYNANSDIDMSITYIDEAEVINYVIGETVEDNKITNFTIMDGDFNLKYEQNYNDEIEYSSYSFYDDSWGYVRNKVNTLDGDVVVSSEYSYTIICDNENIECNNSISQLRDTDGEVVSLLVKSADDSTTKYYLYSKLGLIKEFDEYAIVDNNNVKVSALDNKYDIYNNNGDLLLSGVVNNGSNYSKEESGIVTLYDYYGRELINYDNTLISSVQVNKNYGEDSEIQLFIITDNDSNTIYKITKNGELIKSYDSSYYYIENSDGVCKFYTENILNIIDKYYYFNAYSNTEYVVVADEDGVTKATEGSFGDYDYYTLENSNNIFFYSDAVQILTPYSGDLVPGYCIDEGYMDISTTTDQSYSFEFCLMKIQFDLYIKEAVEDTDTYNYINTNNRMYAYYLINKTGDYSTFQLLYSGFNMINFDIRYDEKYFITSTYDQFCEIYSNKSVDSLVDQTVFYEIDKASEDTNIILNELWEIEKSNMSFMGEYIVCTEDNNYGKNSVYDINGIQILTSSYYVESIRENLAIITFTNGGSGDVGVYDLENNEILESCQNYYIKLLGGGCYRITYYTESGYEYTIKNSKGKTIDDKLSVFLSLETVYDFENSVFYYSYVIGDDESVKLLTITYEIDPSEYIYYYNYI
jgi:hypothetical protein